MDIEQGGDDACVSVLVVALGEECGEEGSDYPQGKCRHENDDVSLCHSEGLPLPPDWEDDIG